MIHKIREGQLDTKNKCHVFESIDEEGTILHIFYQENHKNVQVGLSVPGRGQILYYAPLREFKEIIQGLHEAFDKIE